MDSKYSYSYERTANYCYPDSDVLINKLDIHDGKELFNVEREYVTIRTTDLEINPVKRKS